MKAYTFAILLGVLPAAACNSTHNKVTPDASVGDGPTLPIMLTAVSPTSGTGNGGTMVTLTGANLDASAKVTFGGAACTGVTAPSATQLQCTTTAHKAGVVDVTVTQGSQSGSLSNAYTFSWAVASIGNSSASGTCANGAQSSWCTGGDFAIGSADGEFGAPEGVAIDPAGKYVYVTDAGYDRIERFVLETGAFAGAIGLSTAAGTCVAGAQTAWCTGGSFSAGDGDGEIAGGARGIAVDPGGQYLYLADRGNSRIERFDLATGAFAGAIGNVNSAGGTCTVGAQTTWCMGGVFLPGSGDGMFNVPTGVVADPAGSFLYVTEYGNNRVQRFSLQTGSFAGAIGDSTASGNCAAGAQSNWCTGGTFSAATIDGGFTNPWGTAIDPSGTYLYVTDATGRLQRFTVSSGAFEGTIGNSTASGTCAAGAQTAWCTGGSFSTGTGDGMLSDLATRPVIDPGANYIYVPDWLNYRVQRFTLAGAFAGAIGNSTASGTCTAGAQTSWCNGGTFSMGTADGEFGGTPDIAIDPSGSFLYVADFPVRVQRFNSP